MIDLHTYFMEQALKEAQYARDEGEVPIGAVVVVNGRIIARAHNQVERLHDATAHAEMIAITAASEYLGSKYLTDCAIYITVEPCLMCATALYWSKISAVFYGASDNRYGFIQKQPDLFPNKVLVEGGLLEQQCAAMVKEFFLEKRNTPNSF